jgi:uncharacterized protein (TIGR00290 family)
VPAAAWDYGTMPSRPRVLVSWSSGKDSAWTLHVLRAQGDVEIVGLLCTLNEAHDRVAMHAVRRQLLEAQARAARLPLWPVSIPSPCSNAEYEAAMGAAMARARSEGLDAIAFGDLFLADIRRYREERLATTGVRPLFPLWERPTAALAREMLAAGVAATVTCVDPRQVPSGLAGRTWDAAFLAELPAAADPCGENGEFHTFVSSGPMFAEPIAVRAGEVVERDGFVFADLLPG